MLDSEHIFAIIQCKNNLMNNIAPAPGCKFPREVSRRAREWNHGNNGCATTGFKMGRLRPHEHVFYVCIVRVRIQTSERGRQPGECLEV